jgi:hypothetical protein
VTGTKAEQNLLGAVIGDNRQYEAASRIVHPDHFSDVRLAEIWQGFGLMIRKGEPLDSIIASNKIIEWGIAQINPAEVFVWDNADVFTFAAPEYAEAIRTAAVARGLRHAIDTIQAYQNRGEHAPDVIAEMVRRQLEELIETTRPEVMQAKSLAEILMGSDEYDWVIPGLLERMDRLVVTGPEGSGKTTWVRQMAILSAAGIHPTTFKPIEPVKVLVVDAENTERQWRRNVRWMTKQAVLDGRVDPGLAVHIKAGTRIDITSGPDLSEIHRLIDHHQPDVLFIGPLYKLVPRAITNDDDASPLIVALDSLRERNLALVMEAHAGKATDVGGNRNLAPRGSSALLGWPEFGLGLRPSAEEPGVVDITRWRGDRDERAFPRQMFRGNLWPWMPVEQPE